MTEAYVGWVRSFIHLHRLRHPETLGERDIGTFLTEQPRLTAVELSCAHITANDPADAVLLTADFNAAPSTSSRRLLIEPGLADRAKRAGKPSDKPTFHLGDGIGLWCLDGILVDRL